MNPFRPPAAGPVTAALALGPLALLLPASAPPGSPGPPPSQGVAIDESRELMITSPLVVDDPVRTAPGGPWHFGTLMERLAGDLDPSEFVADWLDTLIEPQTVNDLTVFDQGKADAVAQFKSEWLAASGGVQLDLDLSPFRLLAIVHRPDLVEVSGGGIASYGEGRFVFGAYRVADPTHVERFFVIFEYRLPAQSCAEVLDWAERWHELGSLELGSAPYNAALQEITDDFTLPLVGSGLPNGSLLKQLRTNEFALETSSLVWNLREWNLVAPPGQPDDAPLTAVTTKQTPHFEYLTSAVARGILADYLDLNRPAILAGDHLVPDYFASPSHGTRSFQTGDAINDQGHPQPHGGGLGIGGTKWWAPGYRGLPEQPNVTVEDADVRHRFALQTCSGCHFHETGTPFFMVSNRQVGAESNLSKFLTGAGYPIDDPVIPEAFDAGGNLVPIERSFDDLAHRASVLERMLDLDCGDPPPGGETPLGKLLEIAAETGTRVH